MAWPQPSDYADAIQNLSVSLRDREIRVGRVVTNSLGLPQVRTGNFAAVFEIVSASGQQKWAAKCFTRQISGRQRRYYHIDRHLRDHAQHLPFTVDFQYLPESIRVRENWYAFLKMDWVDGLRLDQFLDICLTKQGYRTKLVTLCDMWRRMAHNLRRAQIGHGDLQHGNVLLVRHPNTGRYHFKLVDYDGMYVPDLIDDPPGEVGHPAYQHPQRLAGKGYGPEVDRFSNLLIFCTIQCLITGGVALWHKHYDGDRLLVGPQDLESPENSPVFQELWRLPESPARTCVARVILAAKGKLEDVPLLEDLFADSKVKPLSVAQAEHIEQLMSRVTAGNRKTALPGRHAPLEDVLDSVWNVRRFPSKETDPHAANSPTCEREGGDVLEAHFAHEWPSTGFLVDAVVPQGHPTQSGQLVVRLRHQLLGGQSEVVVGLPHSCDEPVHYLRLDHFFQQWPLIIRLYFPGRLPKLRRLLEVDDRGESQSFQTCQTSDQITAEDALACQVGPTFYDLIPKGIQLPCVVSRRFETHRQSQQILSVRPMILRDNGCETAPLKIPLGELRSAVPRAAAGVAWCHYLFRVDADGRLTVVARDPLHNLKTNDLLVTPLPTG